MLSGVLYAVSHIARKTTNGLAAQDNDCSWYTINRSYTYVEIQVHTLCTAGSACSGICIATSGVITAPMQYRTVRKIRFGRITLNGHDLWLWPLTRCLRVDAFRMLGG